jgi:hypothetical protein
MNMLNQGYESLKTAGAAVVSHGKVLAVTAAGLGLSVVSMRADGEDPVTTAVTTATGKIDQVATIGVKAYLIAAGLALLGVTIAYIRRAKK